MGREGRKKLSTGTGASAFLEKAVKRKNDINVNILFQTTYTILMSAFQGASCTLDRGVSNRKGNSLSEKGRGGALDGERSEGVGNVKKQDFLAKL